MYVHITVFVDVCLHMRSRLSIDCLEQFKQNLIYTPELLNGKEYGCTLELKRSYSSLRNKWQDEAFQLNYKIIKLFC